MRFSPLTLASTAISSLILTSANACGDGKHDHVHYKRQQKSATSASQTPTRPLEWGELNILHTTDTHGWLLGHLKAEDPEPNYSGDFGDFQSFVYRMKEKARKKKVDLLIIDSGDLHDGNGLGDAEPIAKPGTVPGTTVTKYIAKVPYDVLAIGNHELYELNVAQDMHDNFAPLWNGSYLSSNVNITTSGTSVPVGARYRTFKTEMGRDITAFGVLFDFTGNANGTIVQPPAQMVNETWFKEAITNEPDAFLLAGHMAVNDGDWNIVFDAIRAVHANTPIIILGGHLHIRDCRQLDSRSMSLASGRYMETIGWMSVSGLSSRPTSNPAPLTFSRRYLDQNRNTYKFHSENPKFDTPAGQALTAAMAQTAVDFNITYVYGTVPESYFVSRAPPEANNSMATLLAGPGGVLETVVTNSSRPNPPVVIINSGGIRFDVYAGVFTVSDQYISAPFDNQFVYVADVPRDAAAQVLDFMNSGGASRKRGLEGQAGMIRKDEEYRSGEVEGYFRDWLKAQARRQQMDLPELVARRKGTGNDALTYGYTTTDSCPGQGDDITHLALPSYDMPDYFGTATPTSDTVDIVFYDFIQSYALAAINKAQTARVYTDADVQVYTNVLANQILGEYATAKWKA